MIIYWSGIQLYMVDNVVTINLMNVVTMVTAQYLWGYRTLINDIYLTYRNPFVEYRKGLSRGEAVGKQKLYYI